jgi:hypothetical protein
MSGTEADEQAAARAGEAGAAEARPAAGAGGPDVEAGGPAAQPGGGPGRPAAADRGAAADRAAGGHRRGRGRWVAAGVVAVLAVAAAGGALAAGAFRGTSRPAAEASSGYRTGTAAVTRQSLTSQTQENATLGDAGTWSVTVPSGGSSSSAASSSASASSAGSGTFTWLPQIGQVIRQGQRIYALSGSPVVLLYGSVPAYRELSEGVTGADVTELNRALVALGYATRAALGPRSDWNYYSAGTAYAVELLQAKLGLTVTGSLPLGQAVFLPGRALITGLGTSTVLGGPATAGAVVLTATSTTPVVTIQLDPAMQSEVKDGDPVSITLPDGRTTPGVVTQVGRVATSSSSSSGSSGGSAGSPGGSSNSSAGGSGATITVLASLTHPAAAGKLNQAAVTVTITTGSAPNALTVPVSALLAQPGGYAVEVTGPGGHHLVKVTPGMFDDAAGLVQVSGNLTPGQHVVVPGL